MTWIITIVYAVSLISFVIFSWLAVKHAARFRYLSSRTVYLTIFFVSLSTLIVVLSIATYIGTLTIQ